jgi:hypothetical protein
MPFTRLTAVLPTTTLILHYCLQIMPYVTALTQDLSLPVRAALSDTCMALSPKLGQEHTVRSVLPMLQHFLRDESSEVHILLPE